MHINEGRSQWTLCVDLIGNMLVSGFPLSRLSKSTRYMSRCFSLATECVPMSDPVRHPPGLHRGGFVFVGQM